MQRIPKEYGQYKTDICPYCGKKALTRNVLKLQVCSAHKDTTDGPVLRDMHGKIVDVMSGKFGNYCKTLQGTNIPLAKVLELNNIDVDPQ
jgi:hypothetical protein